MEVITKKQMINGLIDHPYDSTPGYLAHINFFYYSKDKKAFTSYWTAPRGVFSFRWDVAQETIFVISGKLQVISKENKMDVKAGDCIIAGNNEEVQFIIEEDVEAIISLYPITEEVVYNIEKLTKK